MHTCTTGSAPCTLFKPYVHLLLAIVLHLCVMRSDHKFSHFDNSLGTVSVAWAEMNFIVGSEEV